MLYKKSFKTSMVGKKIDKNEAQELKIIYNHYFDNRTEIMKNTSFKVKDVFGDILSKDSISTEQIPELNSFWAENGWIIFLYKPIFIYNIWIGSVF